MRICKIEGCGGKHMAKGLCGKHYQRIACGLPIDGNRKSVKERIEHLTVRVGECWEWQGHVTRRGYGSICISDGKGKKTRPAHRVAYEQHIGDIPPGMVLDHLCRNRKCVNPAHLEPISLRENLARGEGSAALALSQNICKNGHKYTVENTYIRPNGCRDCKICMKNRVLKFKERKNGNSNG